MVLTKSILKMRKVDKRTEENIKKLKLFLKNANTIKRSNDRNDIANNKR
jgi:hypothetical protein